MLLLTGYSFVIENQPIRRRTPLKITKCSFSVPAPPPSSTSHFLPLRLLPPFIFPFLFFLQFSPSIVASLVAQMVKNLPATRETWVQSLAWENSLEKEMATYSSILAWEIPWSIMENTEGLQRDSLASWRELRLQLSLTILWVLHGLWEANPFIWMLWLGLLVHSCHPSVCPISTNNPI